MDLTQSYLAARICIIDMVQRSGIFIMMSLLTEAHPTVLCSICLLLSLLSTTNSQIFNSTYGDISVGDTYQITRVFRAFQFTNIIETIEVVTQRDFVKSLEFMSDTECNTQIQRYYSGITNMETWALEMLDASSKIPSGMLKGNLLDIGMYDECVSVRVVEENMTIVGHHCMYELSGILPTSPIPIKPKLSVCLPAVCDAEDVAYLLQSVINTAAKYMNGTKLNVTSVECSKVDAEPWDTGAIITIVFLGVLICFLIICTIFDCVINQNAFIKTNNLLLRDLCKFSLYTNGKLILSTTIPRGSLPAVTGLRFFSMCWVIYGHSLLQVFGGALINKADLITWSPTWSAIDVLLAPFAVDTFFVISGFLTSYLFLKEMTKRRKFNPIMFYVHRYLRLTPALAALILLTIFVLPRVGSGALWQANMNTQKHYCSEHWWNLLLYIQNYREIEVMACLGHTWYLAVDMQLFWISPLILYPLYRKPRFGVFIFTLFIIASIVTPTIIALENKFSGGLFNIRSMNELVEVMSQYYIRTYNRATPWLMGVFIGYKLASGNNSHGINFMRFGWILTLLSFAFIIFTYRIFQNINYEYNVYWEGFYAGFSRVIWGFGVCWIIYASALGYGGFISNMLSSAILLPFSRISYSVYLVHIVIQGMKVNAARTPQYFSNTQMIHVFFGDLLLATIVGFFFSLLFESPFLVLEKMLMMKIKKQQPTDSREELQVGISNGIDNRVYESNNIHQHA